jgi:hypothetical protein
MAQADDRQAIEYAKCSADAAYFIDGFGVIDDAQGHGDGGGTMPFALWPSQIGVMWSLMTERLVLILKARQLGISWLCCGYALWFCLFQAGKTVLLFSKGQDEANELLRRVKVLYERLPAWLRSAAPQLARPANTQEMVWTHGSRIRSLPASPGAGRSFTASLVVMDEAAFLAFAEPLYTALKPTIDAGGQLIVLSTANGIGNLFHRLWTRASSGLNSFKAIFLPWWSRPGRDAAWYASQEAEYTDLAMVRQEYPATATEAFLVSGRTRFSSDWVTKQARHVTAPLRVPPASLWHIPGLAVYHAPSKRRVIIGADVAEGLEHGDYSAAVGIDAVTWEELFSLHGHWEPDEYAIYLDKLARAYNATLGIERNNHGHAVLVKCKELKTPKIALGHDDRPGWLTNSQTKPQSIDLLATALRDESAIIHTQATLDEMQIYRVLKDGSTGAPAGYFDDRVMSWAVALMLARRPAASFSAAAGPARFPNPQQIGGRQR